MKKSTKNVLLGAGLVTGGVMVGAGLYYGITKALVEVALSRKAVKQQHQRKGMRVVLRGSPKVDDFMEALRVGEEHIRSLETEVWEMESYDGLRLVAHWYPCENAQRIIVAMHGWRSNWANDFGTVCDVWHDSGCSVLYVEQRGQGESDGEYMGFGMTERFDCRDWVNMVDAQNTERLPIYLCGVSMGAATVLMASNLELPDTVCGIIADSGFTSPHAIWKHVVNNNLRMTYGIRGKIAEEMCRKKTTFGSNEITATDALRETTIPVLFIHGTDDNFVPVTMTYENYKACASPKHLLVVPGADHAMSFYIDQAAYESAVQNFWKEYDKKQPST